VKKASIDEKVRKTDFEKNDGKAIFIAHSSEEPNREAKCSRA
jgi:hypothetical protein